MPTPPEASDDLADPRLERGRLHPLRERLVPSPLAVNCGADGFVQTEALVEAREPGPGEVRGLGQARTSDEPDEITAMKEPLRVLDRAGCTVAIFAMGCHAASAAHIIEGEVEHVLALERNHRMLHHEVGGFFEDGILTALDGIPPDAHAEETRARGGHAAGNLATVRERPASSAGRTRYPGRGMSTIREAACPSPSRC